MPYFAVGCIFGYKYTVFCGDDATCRVPSGAKYREMAIEIGCRYRMEGMREK